MFHQHLTVICFHFFSFSSFLWVLHNIIAYLTCNTHHIFFSAEMISPSYSNRLNVLKNKLLITCSYFCICAHFEQWTRFLVLEYVLFLWINAKIMFDPVNPPPSSCLRIIALYKSVPLARLSNIMCHNSFLCLFKEIVFNVSQIKLSIEC